MTKYTVTWEETFTYTKVVDVASEEEAWPEAYGSSWFVDVTDSTLHQDTINITEGE